MPLKKCTTEGKPGYKWGDEGHCYTYTPNDEKSRNEARAKALRQGYAIDPQEVRKYLNGENE
jgi:hypothetical protein